MIDRAFRMAITPADTILMYLPLFHLFGFSEGALMSMVTGARQVLTETFEPAECLALLEQERATVLHGFDTHFKALVEAHERCPRDVSSIRTGVLAAGMSSSAPIARKARKYAREGKFPLGIRPRRGFYEFPQPHWKHLRTSMTSCRPTGASRPSCFPFSMA